MSVARVIDELGEPRFRAEERRSAEQALASAAPLVIAAGGGLIAQHGMVEVLERHATLVCLDAPDADLAGRVRSGGGERPLLRGSPARALHDLRSVRASVHARASLHVATVGRTPAEVAGAVAAALGTAIRVGTAHPYLVRVGPGSAGALSQHLPPAARRAVVIADSAVTAVADSVSAHLRDAGLSVVVVPLEGGERSKTWAVAGSLLERCSDAGLERDDCVVAVGGGSIGDVAGFAAATYHRGIAWLVVPTTLLAMVDAAIGGKTGVNLRRGKNLAGAFWQPRAVLCDPGVLDTLPDRPFRSAFAEVVKVAMIGEAGLAATLESHLEAALGRDHAAITAVVRACCELKAEVVAGDEREGGRRAILNYGHTVGHAVEAMTGMGDGLDHGEAVGFGMRVAGALSVVATGCPAADVSHQDDLLDACGLAQRPQLRAEDIAARVGLDKKARGGVARWVLLRRRGEPVTGIVVPPSAVDRALGEVMAA